VNAAGTDETDYSTKQLKFSLRK